MADATVRGRFVWHELWTPNPDGAFGFYGKAVGWSKQVWDPDPSYLMFAAANGPIGAAVEARDGTPQWLPYIGTTDVDQTVEAATRLGATVTTPPTPLPNGGRYAVLADPQGAPFGIHAPGAEHQPEKSPEAGEFSWHELATTVAPNIAFAFYAALFDWDEMAEHDMGPMGKYLVFGRNGRQLGGMFDKGAQGKPGNAYWLGYVSVADLEPTIERVREARGSVLVGPMDVPGGDRIVQLMDPYGAFFALHQSTAAQAAPAEQAADARPRAARKPAAARQRTSARKPAARKPAPRKRPTGARKSAAKKRGTKAGKKKRAGAAKGPARRTAKSKPKTKRSARKSTGKKTKKTKRKTAPRKRR